MKFVLDINDSILQRKNLTEFDVKMILGVALLNGGVTSTGKTAEILGMSYRRFYENMGEYDGIKFERTLEDVLKDCENARNYG
jgi:predicted HTH domain antitoxin